MKSKNDPTKTHFDDIQAFLMPDEAKRVFEFTS